MLQANACLDEWAAVLWECPWPFAHEVHLERLFELASTYLLPPDRGGTIHPVISSVRRKAKERNGASGLIKACYERPGLGQAERRTRRSAEGGLVIYVAVVNQVRGDELDWVIVCALSKNRLPHGGEDSFGERCRWWVAISRPREGTSHLGVEGNDLY